MDQNNFNSFTPQQQSFNPAQTAAPVATPTYAPEAPVATPAYAPVPTPKKDSGNKTTLLLIIIKAIMPICKATCINKNTLKNV